MKILLGSKSTVDSKNIDSEIRINLSNTQSFFSDDLLYKIIDETEQFQKERNLGKNYLLYGKVESLMDDKLDFDDYELNNLNYNIEIGYISHYQPQENYIIKILSFDGTKITIPLTNNILIKNDVIILYKDINNIIFSRIVDIDSSGVIITLDIDTNLNLTDYNLVPNNAVYKRIFKSLITTDFIKFYNSSFSTNIFSDTIGQFHTYKNINIDGLVDNLGLLITDLILRIEKKNKTIISLKSIEKVLVNDLNCIDFVEYNLNELEYSILDSAIYTISEDVDFYYKPFYFFTVRNYSKSIVKSDITNEFQYPIYSIKFNNGDLLYRQYLDIGYFEQGTNGVDYPFINNLHYLFLDFKFIIRRIIPIANYTNNILIDPALTNYDNNAIKQLNNGGARLC